MQATTSDEIVKQYCSKLYLRLFGCEIPAWLLARDDVDDILFHAMYGVWRKKEGSK